LFGSIAYANYPFAADINAGTGRASWRLRLAPRRAQLAFERLFLPLTCEAPAHLIAVNSGSQFTVIIVVAQFNRISIDRSAAGRRSLISIYERAGDPIFIASDFYDECHFLA
jgi:hypothetical protein